jgi:hypothetical protein
MCRAKQSPSVSSSLPRSFAQFQGLSALIKERQRSKILIDGNAVVITLATQCSNEARLFHNYTEFAQDLTVFVQALRGSGAEIVFYFDSGSVSDFKFEESLTRIRDNAKKLRISLERLKARNDAFVRELQSSWPILKLEAVLVLKELAVTVVQCIGEADWQLAYDARKDANVLAIVSNDSDFIVCENARLIPLDSIELHESEPHSVDCKLIDNNFVLNKLGVPSLELLIDAAILSGNDYSRQYNLLERVCKQNHSHDFGCAIRAAKAHALDGLLQQNPALRDVRRYSLMLYRSKKPAKKPVHMDSSTLVDTGALSTSTNAGKIRAQVQQFELPSEAWSLCQKRFVAAVAFEEIDNSPSYTEVTLRILAALALRIGNSEFELHYRAPDCSTKKSRINPLAVLQLRDPFSSGDLVHRLFECQGVAGSDAVRRCLALDSNLHLLALSLLHLKLAYQQLKFGVSQPLWRAFALACAVQANQARWLEFQLRAVPNLSYLLPFRYYSLSTHFQCVIGLLHGFLSIPSIAGQFPGNYRLPLFNGALFARIVIECRKSPVNSAADTKRLLSSCFSASEDAVAEIAETVHKQASELTQLMTIVDEQKIEEWEQMEALSASMSKLDVEERPKGREAEFLISTIRQIVRINHGCELQLEGLSVRELEKTRQRVELAVKVKQLYDLAGNEPPKRLFAMTQHTLEQLLELRRV